MLIEIVNPTDKRAASRFHGLQAPRISSRGTKPPLEKGERVTSLCLVYTVLRYDPVSIAVASHFFPPLSAVIKPHRWHIFLSMFMDRAMIRSWMERGKFFLFVTSRDIDF